MELPSPLVRDPATQQNFDAIKRKLAVLDVFHLVTGDPNGQVTAPVGHVALRADGGAGTTLYVKEVGVDDNGWAGK